MTKHSFICILLILFFRESDAQLKSSKKLKGTYISLWASTKWTYDFLSDSTYVFYTQGHFGNMNTKGSYSINRDTIKLKAFSKEKQDDPEMYINEGFLFFESDTCLIDLETGYEHLLMKDPNVVYASKKRNLKRKGMPVVKQY